jgi:hypothetical protein
MDLEFYEAIFPTKQGILAASFMKGPADKKKITNRFYDLSKGFDLFFKDCTNAVANGYDCYFVPAVMKEEGRKKQHFKESHALWVDYDGDDGAPLVIPPEVPKPSYKIESSPGKFHLYWLLDQAATALQTECTNQALYQRLKGDKSGWDRVQLLRVPGTANYKRDQIAEVKLIYSNNERRPLGSFPFLWGDPIPGLRQTFV